MPYQPFSWDEGNVVADVYQMISYYFSYSFFINRESTCSSIPSVDIVDISGFHHCLEDISYTMVDAILCISFNFTNLSQFDCFLKYESREDCQDNEALRSTQMVMSGPHSFGLYLGINKFNNTKIPSPRTPHTYFMHGSHSVCYFPIDSFHQFYDSNDRFYDRIEA
jgi:hypothetical protein